MPSREVRVRQREVDEWTEDKEERERDSAHLHSTTPLFQTRTSRLYRENDYVRGALCFEARVHRE